MAGGRGFWLTWKGAIVALAAVAVVGASFVTPKLLNSESPAAAPAHATGLDEGAGLRVGAAVPSFAERDVVTGGAITSESIQHRKTLLFFSEGVMCQACFEQIKGLERMGDVLERRGIQLVSITPDTAPDLAQAIGQYGIATPMIADDDRDMSRAFNTLGQGMHGDTPGHAFVLVERGKVLWQRDYWLAPDRTMYVEPEKLLDDIPSA
ncbi:MAG TPA: redoxin domain-containing protein [Gaiellaceae bacterium]|nr:redoxin domain-containing protein [Gaiellaceae bacterium]